MLILLFDMYIKVLPDHVISVTEHWT